MKEKEVGEEFEAKGIQRMADEFGFNAEQKAELAKWHGEVLETRKRCSENEIEQTKNFCRDLELCGRDKTVDDYLYNLWKEEEKIWCGFTKMLGFILLVIIMGGVGWRVYLATADNYTGDENSIFLNHLPSKNNHVKKCQKLPKTTKPIDDTIPYYPLSPPFYPTYNPVLRY